MSGQGSAGLRKGDWEIETSVDGAGGAKGLQSSLARRKLAAVQ
jgi:hypothetical protein